LLLQAGVPTALTALAAAPLSPTEKKLERVLPTGGDLSWSVALSRDGTKVVTRSYGKTAILWDAAAGKPLQVLQGHRTGVHVGADYDGKITSVAISADGKKVVTGSFDNTAILWDAATGKRLRTFDQTWIVSSVALSADGKHLVTGSAAKPAILWETATGKKLQTIGESNDRMALSADGTRLVTYSYGWQMLWVWDTATGKKLQTVKHDAGINCLTLSADGKNVLAVDMNPSSLANDLIVWEVASGKKLRTFQVLGPQPEKRAAKIKKPDRPVVEERPPADRDKPTKPDADRFQELLDRANTTWIQSVAISVEGDQIITGCEAGTTNLWDAASGKKLHTFQGHTSSVMGVALSADGKHAWTAAPWEGTTRLWDTNSGKELCALVSFDSGKDWLVVTPEGFFDGSQGAWKRMSFRETGTGKVLNDDAIRKKFHRPGLLGTLYRGEKPKP
jgi:WD40 repeat protein